MFVIRAKTILLIVLLLLMAAVKAARAEGACPIVVDELVGVHAPASDLSRTFADTLFGLTLAGPEAQSFSGHLVSQTDDEQYSVALPQIALKITVNPNGIKYGASEPYFIAFDKPTAVAVVWLDDMKTEQSKVLCAVRPIIYDRTYLSSVEKIAASQQLQYEAKIRSAPRSVQNTLHATLVAPIASLPCRTPNAEATAYHLARPGAMRGLQGKSTVMVTLSADGTVLETHTYKSSGSDLLDALSEQAAKESRYTAAMRKCRPSGGQYLFVVEFR